MKWIVKVHLLKAVQFSWGSDMGLCGKNMNEHEIWTWSTPRQQQTTATSGWVELIAPQALYEVPVPKVGDRNLAQRTKGTILSPTKSKVKKQASTGLTLVLADGGEWKLMPFSNLWILPIYMSLSPIMSEVPQCIVLSHNKLAATWSRLVAVAPNNECLHLGRQVSKGTGGLSVFRLQSWIPSQHAKICLQHSMMWRRPLHQTRGQINLLLLSEWEVKSRVLPDNFLLNDTNYSLNCCVPMNVYAMASASTTFTPYSVFDRILDSYERPSIPGLSPQMSGDDLANSITCLQHWQPSSKGVVNKVVWPCWSDSYNGSDSKEAIQLWGAWFSNNIK